MSEIAALRPELVRTLRQFGAPEPEDGAQIILMRAWKAGRLSGQLWHYWKAACRNMASDQWKRQHRRPGWYEEHDKETLVTPLWAEESWILGKEVDPMATLALTDAEKAWLLDYYNGKGHKSPESVKAFRLRNKARNAAV